MVSCLLLAGLSLKGQTVKVRGLAQTKYVERGYEIGYCLPIYRSDKAIKSVVYIQKE